MSFWLLQRGRTWPPSVGCCITCERPNIMSERGNAQFSHLLQVLHYLRGFTQTAEGQMPSSTAPKQRTNPGHLRTILLKIRPILSVPTVSRDCIHPLAAAYTVSYVVGFVHRFKSFSWNCRDCFFLLSQYSSVLLLFPPPISAALMLFLSFSQLPRCDLNKLRWTLSAKWELLGGSASCAVKSSHSFVSSRFS